MYFNFSMEEEGRNQLPALGMSGLVPQSKKTDTGLFPLVFQSLISLCISVESHFGVVVKPLQEKNISSQVLVLEKDFFFLLLTPRRVAMEKSFLSLLLHRRRQKAFHKTPSFAKVKEEDFVAGFAAAPFFSSDFRT